MTALILASYNCDLEIVKLLLNHGADVNSKDNEDKTALITAFLKYEEDSFVGYDDYLKRGPPIDNYEVAKL